jgi:hypothetical protein
VSKGDASQERKTALKRERIKKAKGECLCCLFFLSLIIPPQPRAGRQKKTASCCSAVQMLPNSSSFLRRRWRARRIIVSYPLCSVCHSLTHSLSLFSHRGTAHYHPDGFVECFHERR